MQTNAVDARSLVIVDECPWDYEPIDQVAHERGVELTLVTSSRSALRLSQTAPPRVWFVNSRLPEFDSFELAEMVSQFEPRPLVFVVADAFDADEEIKALHAGACGYLCKPVVPQWLTACRPFARRPEAATA